MAEDAGAIGAGICCTLPPRSYSTRPSMTMLLFGWDTVKWLLSMICPSVSRRVLHRVPSNMVLYPFVTSAPELPVQHSHSKQAQHQQTLLRHVVVVLAGVVGPASRNWTLSLKTRSNALRERSRNGGSRKQRELLGRKLVRLPP